MLHVKIKDNPKTIGITLIKVKEAPVKAPLLFVVPSKTSNSFRVRPVAIKTLMPLSRSRRIDSRVDSPTLWVLKETSVPSMSKKTAFIMIAKVRIKEISPEQ